jgi:hypothetical protein
MVNVLCDGYENFPVYKTEINGRGNQLRRPRDILYPQRLALTSPTSGGNSVGIGRLRTKSHGDFYENFISRIKHKHEASLQSKKNDCLKQGSNTAKESQSNKELKITDGENSVFSVTVGRLAGAKEKRCAGLKHSPDNNLERFQYLLQSVFHL